MARVNTVDVIGDEALSAKIIDRSIAELVDSTITNVGTDAFYRCPNLSAVDLLSVSNISSAAFNECTKLTTLILRNGTVCALETTGALSRTPIAGYGGGTGYIYVPAALVDSYKAATNWSTYAARFRALEDYTVDGTTTGELDPNKI